MPGAAAAVEKGLGGPLSEGKKPEELGVLLDGSRAGGAGQVESCKIITVQGPAGSEQLS